MMNWEDLEAALNQMQDCGCNGCDTCKEISSKILEFTQESHKEELQKVIKEKLVKIDDLMMRAFSQYKPVMAGYHYGRISTLSELLEDKHLFVKTHLPTTVKIRAFCNSMKKSIAYLPEGEYEQLDRYLSDGD
jgi:hypothetical protein